MTRDPKPIIAVVDETSPSDRMGIYYVVTAAILLDPDATLSGLTSVVPTRRTRPFHWATEGPHARGRMLGLIRESGVVAHVVVHHPTGRKQQERSRSAAMQELIPLAIADGHKSWSSNHARPARTSGTADQSSTRYTPPKVPRSATGGSRRLSACCGSRTRCAAQSRNISSARTKRL